MHLSMGLKDLDKFQACNLIKGEMLLIPLKMFSVPLFLQI